MGAQDRHRNVIPSPASPAALRQRRLAERRRLGRAVVPVEVDWIPLTETLIERRILPPAECDDRVAVRRAIETWLRLSSTCY